MECNYSLDWCELVARTDTRVEGIAGWKERHELQARTNKS